MINFLGATMLVYGVFLLFCAGGYIAAWVSGNELHREAHGDGVCVTVLIIGFLAAIREMLKYFFFL